MPTIVAIRCNADLERTDDALMAKGKPPKVAVTAGTRKLLVLANTLVQQDRPGLIDPGKRDMATAAS